MYALGTAYPLSLLLIVAALAAVSGFSAAVLARTKKRRPRRIFVVGFVCGLAASTVLRRRRRRLNIFRAVVPVRRPARAKSSGQAVFNVAQRISALALGFALR